MRRFEVFIMETVVPKEYYQLAFIPPVRMFFALTDSQKEKIRMSFEGFFRREILPLIPVNLVRKLYSDRGVGRPSNYMVQEVAARIYIKCQGLTETYFLEHVHTDVAIQYALSTEDLKDQPFSRNTFKRQRERIRKCNIELGIDIWDQITSCIDSKIADKMNLSNRYSVTFQEAYRIDSMMIDGHGASMTRLEIIYTTIYLAVDVMHNLGIEDYIPLELVHYLDEKDHNRLLYYKGTIAEIGAECKKHGIPLEEIKNIDVSDNQDAVTDDKKKRLELIADLRIAIITNEISIAIKMMESVGLTDTQEYSNLVRVLDDQTKLDVDGNRVPKNKKEIVGSSLQNPYDPQMTYRSKNRIGFHGYSAFFAEKFTPNGYGIIVKRYFEPNIHSDQAFARRFYSEFPDSEKKTIAVCSDALFTSNELQSLADQKGISIFCASTTGRPPNDILADFIFNEDRTKILECPVQHRPISSEYDDKKGGQIKIVFDNPCCKGCQYEEACHATTTKRKPHSSVTISLNQVLSATNIKMLKDATFRNMINKRNAVEGIPSVMRRKYNIDEIPYFGLQYAAECFYTDCTSYNTMKLYRWKQRNGE